MKKIKSTYPPAQRGAAACNVFLKLADGIIEDLPPVEREQVYITIGKEIAKRLGATADWQPKQEGGTK